MRAALLALLLVGCSNVHVNRAALYASTAALACDWGQTRGAAELNWQYATEENPIMGPTPTTGTVDGYFAIIGMVNVLLFAAMPRRYRWIVPTVITGVQTTQIVRNVQMNANNIHAGVTRDIGVCGL